MKLGYLVPQWPTQTHAFFWREISALRSFGVDVSIFSTSRPESDACLHPFADEARASTRYLFPPRGVESLKLMLSRPGGMARALGYGVGLKESSLKNRGLVCGQVICAADLAAHAQELGLDHIHVHSCAQAAHLVAAARRLGGPGYSLTLHGDLDVYGMDHQAKMREARFVTAVTQPLRRQIIEKIGLDPSVVPVISMGVDTERFSPAQPSSSQLSSTQPVTGAQKPIRLVTIARLNPTKGHQFTLEALKSLKDEGIDFHYSIAGEGPHRAAIEKRIAELELHDSVELLGSIGEDQVLEQLRGADMFILSSEGLGEAAPVSVMEAMSVGLPVVCSLIGGTGDMITDGVDGLLVPQRDVGAIAQALRKLALDLPFREAVGQAARRRAVDKFDYRATAKSLYDTMVRSLEVPVRAQEVQLGQTGA